MSDCRNFKDCEGQTWGLRVDRASLRRVQADCGVLLTSLFADEFALLTTLSEDVLAASDVLWSLSRLQAKERDITKERFEELTDSVFEEAFKCMVEAVIDFFPQKKREAMRKLIEVAETAESQITTNIDKITEKAREEFSEMLTAALSRSSTNSPESSEDQPST